MIINNKGEKTLYLPSHPNATKWGRIRNHRLRAAQALGKSLRKGIEVHHTPRGELVVCQDKAYHQFLHLRESALQATGNVNYRKCCKCQQWSDPENGSMYITVRTYRPHSKGYVHKDCSSAYQKGRRQREKTLNN